MVKVMVPVRPEAKITKETWLFWYGLMLRLRYFEEKAQQAYMQQKIRGFLHLYIGQEAIAAGTMTAARPSDPIITAYRDHGLALARGVSARSAMAELFGKAAGCSGGKGGSMHLFSKEHNFFGGHAIVGAQIPLGAGIALAEKYKGTDNVCLCFFGDGAARQGALHETFNMAMLWKLPVLFICENNNYAMGTSVERTSNVQEVYKLGAAYGMPSRAVNGMRCDEVHEKLLEALDHARKGNGPVLIEMKTYRYRGHSMSDPGKYRTREELDSYRKLDPLETVKDIILKNQYAGENTISMMQEKTRQEIDDALGFAEEALYPEPGELFTGNYMQPDYPFITE